MSREKTLRDEIAIAYLMANADNEDLSPVQLATESYIIADLMMNTRELETDQLFARVKKSFIAKWGDRVKNYLK